MKKMNTKQLVLNAIELAILVVSSYIAFPFTYVSFTLQTLAVFIIILINDLVSSMFIILTYIIMGLIGIPVFSNFTSGITSSFGFIIGFLVSGIVINIFKKVIVIKNQTIKDLILLTIAFIIIYLFGIVFLSIYLSIDIVKAFLIGGANYLIFDILKIILAIFIVKRIKPYLRRDNNV